MTRHSSSSQRGKQSSSRARERDVHGRFQPEHEHGDQRQADASLREDREDRERRAFRERMQKRAADD
jgi:hypothetical protein